MGQDEFGPFIQHDGKGCPPEVIGRVIEGQIECAVNAKGVKAGSVITECGLITQELAVNPNWDWQNFGRVMQARNGNIYSVGRVIQYRIRKDRAVERMRKKAAALDCVAPRTFAACGQ